MNKKYIKYGAVFLIAIGVLYYWENIIGALGIGISAASPLFIGVIMAYVSNIVMSAYEKLYFPKSNKKLVAKTKRPVCILLSFASVVAVLVLVMNIVIPELWSSIQLLFEEVPLVLEKSYIWIVNNEMIKPYLEQTAINPNIDWEGMVKNLIGFVAAGAGGVMNSALLVATRFFSLAAQLLIGFIFSIYLLANKEKVISQIKRLLAAYGNKAVIAKLYYVLGVANDTFKNFIVGQCTEALILGGLCAVGMMLLGFPYAGMTGAVVGITALIPVAGAYIGAAVGAFMILTVNPLQALLFVVYLVILQQLEGNIIYPRVVGGSIGLPGMWVLAAVTIGGGLMGIIGMLFGVPLAATAYKLLRNDVNKKLQDKKETVTNANNDQKEEKGEE